MRSCFGSSRTIGKIYGFPRDNDTTVLYYNKDLFDDAGVAYPDETWTWDEFLEAAKALTVRDARGRVVQYGVVLESNKYFNFLHQNGADMFDDPLNPTRFTLDDPKAIEALQFMADLINEHQVAPSFAQMLQLGSSTELFQTGRVAMAMTNAARIPTFQQAPFEWGVAPLPAGRTGIRANTMGGAGYVISANTKHPEEAWTFLKFLAGEEGQAIFAKTGVAVPAYRSEKTRQAFVNALPTAWAMSSWPRPNTASSRPCLTAGWNSTPRSCRRRSTCCLSAKRRPRK